MKWHLTTAALALLAAMTPASAQYYGESYGWDGYERDPYWQRRAPQRPQWREDGTWGYGGEPERAPEIRSGGARPFISPKAPPRIALRNGFPVNSIVIDTEGRALYYILSPNDAYRYPISVGREGFAWTGNEVISRKQEWPDWIPPKEMVARDPRVPDKMTGGINNPLGALALYLGNTLYRIHGTNDPNSIGRAASSGCFRMMNEHVLHLASLATIGTPVAVVKHLPGELVASHRMPAPPTAQSASRYAPRSAEREPADDPYDEPRGYTRYDPYDPYERYQPYDRYGGYDRWDRY